MQVLIDQELVVDNLPKLNINVWLDDYEWSDASEQELELLKLATLSDERFQSLEGSVHDSQANAYVDAVVRDKLKFFETMGIIQSFMGKYRFNIGRAAEYVPGVLERLRKVRAVATKRSAKHGQYWYEFYDAETGELVGHKEKPTSPIRLDADMELMENLHVNVTEVDERVWN